MIKSNSPALSCVYKGRASYQSLATGNLSLRVALKFSCVLIMQIMPERSGKLLLIILCLLPCSVTSNSFECSLSAEENFFTLFFSSCFYQNTSNQFPNGSARCSSRPFTCTQRYPASTLGPGLSSFVFIIVDLAPLIVYFPVLIIFNINLASGPAQSFLFFYHAVTASYQLSTAPPPGIDLFWGWLIMQSPINDVLFPHTLPYIGLQHFKLLVVVMAIVMTIVLVKCIHCPCAFWRHPWAKLRRSTRYFREKHAQKGTVLNGLCSIGILTYGFVIQQAFSVLRPSHCCPGGANFCAYYCTELEYGKADCRLPLGLIWVAAVFSIALALFLPLLLLYYPCGPALMQRVTKRSPQFVTCHKLAPVLDVFQSAYKPKLRFFAALPLLYRFVIWFLFSMLSAVLEPSDRLIVITFVFIVILAIHSLVQPYRKPKHNYIETLYLANVVLISMMWLISQLATRLRANIFYFSVLLLTIPLIFLPMLVCVGYFFWKRKCCKRCRAICMKAKRNRRGSAETEVLQAPTSDVYFDMGELGLMSQEDF